MRRLLIIAVASVTAFCFGAVKLRAPKDQPSGKLMAKRTAAAVQPSPPIALVIIRPPKPFHIPLFWEPIPGASTYKLYVGSNSLPAFTSVWETANNFIAASNLWHGTEYTFAVTSVDTNGVESDYSPLLHWPRPVTNYLAFGVSASKLGFWSTNTIVTNPPNLFFCRLQRLPNALQFQTSTNLMAWLAATNWPMTNPPMAFYLHQSHWDNANYERPD